MDDLVKQPYVSLIKIDGKPILPPLITPELCKELLKYKQQAVRLEQRLEQCRKLKSNLEQLQECFRCVEHVTQSKTGALNPNCDKHSDLKLLKNINLSKELIEVTQYNGCGVKTFSSNTSLSDSNSQKVQTELKCDNVTRPSRCQSESRKKVNMEKMGTDLTTCKPRLIRSNSYTLESPSPVLLEHLRNNSVHNASINNNNNNSDSTHDTKVLISTSTENGNFIVNNNDVSNKSTPINQCNHGQTDTSVSLDSPDLSSRTVELSVEHNSPVIEVYQTDISVQQITVNTCDKATSNKEAKSEMFFAKNPFQVMEPDSELLNVLKDIPDEYAQQIIELLNKQHIEQKQRLERYDGFKGGGQELDSVRSDCRFEKNQANVSTTNEGIIQETPSEESNSSVNLIDLSSIEYQHPPQRSPQNLNDRPSTTESINSNNSVNLPSETLRRSSTFSISPSQSLYYSVTSDSDTITSRAVPCNDLVVIDNNDLKDLEIGVLREKNGYLEGILMHENRKNISRELFREFDPLTVNVTRQERAASVIGAHVRGYLTRRLFRTEKVQNVIATIKDVLVCAVELHQSDHIDEKDVELHRRLINQLSAALFSFHEIFFDLPIKEQMSIISTDRQRKLEKLKRPLSGRSSRRSRASNLTI